MLDWIGPDWQLTWLHAEKLGLTCRVDGDHRLAARIGRARHRRANIPDRGNGVLQLCFDPWHESRRECAVARVASLITGIGFVGGGADPQRGATITRNRHRREHLECVCDRRCSRDATLWHCDLTHRAQSFHAKSAAADQREVGSGGEGSGR